MKKFIINLFIFLIFIIIFIAGLFFLNEYIIGSEEIAEIFSPVYDDEVITISKTPEDQTIENPLDLIQTTNNSNIDNIDKFYYSQLDDYAKIIYDKIYENKENMKSGNYTIDFKKTFSELLNSENGDEKMNTYYQSALDAYILDNPDVFYLDISKIYLLMNSRTLGKKTTYTVTIGAQDNQNYYAEGYYSKEDIERAIANVENVSNQMLSYASGSDYDKVKKLHNILVDNLSYDQTISKPNIRNIYGALCEREVVCEGYAKAYKYLLDKLEIENIIVVGYGTNSSGQTEEHAWNYIKLNDNWYAVDVTWDDPIIIGGGKLTDSNRYKYFLKGAHSFNDSHVITGKTSEGGIIFKYPELNTADFK